MSDVTTHTTCVHNALMQTPPTATETVTSVQHRLMSAMQNHPAVLSAVQLKQRVSPGVSDDHAGKQEGKVSNAGQGKHVLSLFCQQVWLEHGLQVSSHCGHRTVSTSPVPSLLKPRPMP